jgi:hypothetical protein
MKKLLMRLARAVLDQVLQGLSQQFNIVQEAAMAPIKAIIGEVVGGAWIGKGADAFVNELSSIAIPGVTRIGDAITAKIGNLGKARDIVDQADAQCRGIVNGLRDKMKFY